MSRCPCVSVPCCAQDLKTLRDISRHLTQCDAVTFLSYLEVITSSRCSVFGVLYFCIFSVFAPPAV